MPTKSSAPQNPVEYTPHLTEPNTHVLAFRNKNGIRASALIHPENREVMVMIGVEDYSFYQSLRLSPQNAATLGRLLIEGAAFFGVTQ